MTDNIVAIMNDVSHSKHPQSEFSRFTDSELLNLVKQDKALQLGFAVNDNQSNGTGIYRRFSILEATPCRQLRTEDFQ